ncbi:hypothetical protein EC396_09100 [Lutibacter sp. HS1-25]|uniref:hypothetical protein n=1 Tax=Lutibacter sp. HS1-25 TaxID=2485000 RepID=UPI001013A1F5|nr:hypothetical protein [Lutibacter sp. HS1-25]RXP54528.1 hypothetical protein EC396_09100 [Lutibacter sp. HS1-25]
MKIKNLAGTYTIIGSNQDASDNNYKGTLTLELDTNNRISAKWLIGSNQKQVGTGFFKDNILVINFSYIGENLNTFKGVVVYRCISNDILDGFWSEEYGDPLNLGTERCFRIKDKKELLN